MKTRYLFSLAVALLAASSAFGQDRIVTFDSQEIEAKIVEVTNSQIKYRRFSNPDGPIFNIARRDVMKIEYENGEIDGQSIEGELRIRNNSKYFIGDTRVSRRQVLQLAAPYNDVVRNIKAGVRMKWTAIATGAAGGGILTFVGVAWTSGSKPSYEYDSRGLTNFGWSLIITGSVLGVASIGLGLGSLGTQKRAMTLYNGYIDRAEIPTYEPKLALGFTPGGVGLQLTF